MLLCAAMGKFKTSAAFYFASLYHIFSLSAIKTKNLFVSLIPIE